MNRSELASRFVDVENLPWEPTRYPGIEQKTLLVEKETGLLTALMRMAPGAATVPHVHEAREEFMVLEGEAIESDGTVLKAGDWVVYEPGTFHGTRTLTGCLLLGLDWDPPERS